MRAIKTIDRIVSVIERLLKAITSARPRAQVTLIALAALGVAGLAICAVVIVATKS
jgi:hypothetical protein